MRSMRHVIFSSYMSPKAIYATAEQNYEPGAVKLAKHNGKWEENRWDHHPVPRHVAPPGNCRIQIRSVNRRSPRYPATRLVLSSGQPSAAYFSWLGTNGWAQNRMTGDYQLTRAGTECCLILDIRDAIEMHFPLRADITHAARELVLTRS